VLCAAWSLSAHAGSARLSLERPSGLTAVSDYWAGEADRPAILILHGFLQTREFPTAAPRCGRVRNVTWPAIRAG
jgi:hypothetical protein